MLAKNRVQAYTDEDAVQNRRVERWGQRDAGSDGEVAMSKRITWLTHRKAGSTQRITMPPKRTGSS